jgi:hypothetical protein
VGVRYVAHAIREQPSVVVARHVDDVRRSQQLAADVDITGAVHDVAGATERIDSGPDQVLEGGAQPPVFGVNVTDQSQTSNPRTH